MALQTLLGPLHDFCEKNALFLTGCYKNQEQEQ